MNSHKANGNGHKPWSASYTTSTPNGLRQRLANGSQQASPAFEPHEPLLVEKIVDWEIPRKVLHGSIGFITLPLYFLKPTSLQPIIEPLAAGLVIVASADFLRLRYPKLNHVYTRLLGPLMRESEKTQTNGVVWYLVGVIFVLALYPRDISVVSILILSWADTVASTFGRMYGHLTPKLPYTFLGLPLAKRKSVAGSFAAFVAGALIAASFWGWSVEAGGMRGHAVWEWDLNRWTGRRAGLALFSLGVGLITSVTEALDLGALDDNMTLPIIGGGAIWLWSNLFKPS